MSDASEAMAGKVVGVQRGTINESFMRAHYPMTPLKLYGNQEHVLIDLTLGGSTRCSARRCNSTRLPGDAGGGGLRLLRRRPFRPGDPGRGRGDGVRKQDAALRDRLSAAIAAIRRTAPTTRSGSGTSRSISTASDSIRSLRRGGSGSGREACARIAGAAAPERPGAVAKRLASGVRCATQLRNRLGAALQVPDFPGFYVDALWSLRLTTITDTDALAVLRRGGGLSLRHRRHRVPARAHLLRPALPGAAGPARQGRRGGGAGRHARRAAVARAALRAVPQPRRGQGVPRRAAGSGDLRRRRPACCRSRSSTPRSRRWSAAMAIRPATRRWRGRSPAPRSTSPRASPTGAGGR